MRIRHAVKVLRYRQEFLRESIKTNETGKELQYDL